MGLQAKDLLQLGTMRILVEPGIGRGILVEHVDKVVLM
jgi:hypothetical protein